MSTELVFSDIARAGMTTASDLGVLFDRHAPALLRFVERIAGRGAHAEDVVQEVFLIANRGCPPFADAEEAKKWLYGVAANCVRHHRRSLARRLRLVFAARSEPASHPIAGPDDMLARHQTAEAVRQVVDALPHKLREVFVLHELEELEGPDIARLLGIKANTMWSRLRLARDRFRTLWMAREARP